jgi:ribosome-associated translation inhibitor RaiA
VTLTTRTRLRNVFPNELEARRIRRQFHALGQRVATAPDPVATLLLTELTSRRDVEAKLRLRVGHLGGHPVSKAMAGSADHAVRLAIEKLERQLVRTEANPRI